MGQLNVAQRLNDSCLMMGSKLKDMPSGSCDGSGERHFAGMVWIGRLARLARLACRYRP